VSALSFCVADRCAFVSARSRLSTFSVQSRLALSFEGKKREMEGGFFRYNRYNRVTLASVTKGLHLY